MSEKIRDFTNLYAWQAGKDFVVSVYEVTKKFPREELFGLTSQLRRAAVSVPSNVAEGFARFSYKEKTQFYNIAQASLVEAQNQLLIARDIGFLSANDLEVVYNKSVSARKLLNALIRGSTKGPHSKF